MLLGAVLELDVRVVAEVVDPEGMLGAPPSEPMTAYSPSCSTRISGVLRSLPLLAPTEVSTTTGRPRMSPALAPPVAS